RAGVAGAIDAGAAGVGAGVSGMHEVLRLLDRQWSGPRRQPRHGHPQARIATEAHWLRRLLPPPPHRPPFAGPRPQVHAALRGPRDAGVRLTRGRSVTSSGPTDCIELTGSRGEIPARKMECRVSAEQWGRARDSNPKDLDSSRRATCLARELLDGAAISPERRAHRALGLHP